MGHQQLEAVIPADDRSKCVWLDNRYSADVSTMLVVVVVVVVVLVVVVEALSAVMFSSLN